MGSQASDFWGCGDVTVANCGQNPNLLFLIDVFVSQPYCGQNKSVFVHVISKKQ